MGLVARQIGLGEPERLHLLVQLVPAHWVLAK